MKIDSLAADPLKLCGANGRNFRALLAALALLSASDAANAQTALPTDADSQRCSFVWFSVMDWFPSNPGGTIQINGIVNPADSVNFPGISPTNSNCDFYKWSAQMFLWLTSPPPPHHGQNSHVFDSPLFFDVSPPDPTTRQRTLKRITSGNLRTFEANIPQRGPQGKPVVFDSTGKMFTVVQPEVGPRGKPLIRNEAGQPVEIERAQIAPDGKPNFLDKAGKTIDHQVLRNGNPRLLDRSGRVINLQNSTVTINGKTLILDTENNVVDFEQGEADGNVLMAQNGSLVYYALQVNDVYASFLTGQKINRITATNFPTTQPELTNIQNFAGETFPDANVLTVELKTAWIETTGLANVADYITITATIPNYKIVDSRNWSRNGSRTAQLALVGMHIVGSAMGHPEMIWATFEHVNNTPNVAYTYNATGTGLTMVPADTGGTWLFSATPPVTAPESPRMRLSGADIMAIGSPDISASNVLRVNPWGTGPDPNANPDTITINNTDIITTNHSVRFRVLSAGDVRQKYILTGTTWSAAIPPDPNDKFSQLGTNQMSNTTMETFQQPSNCFDCHNGSMLGTLTVQTQTPPMSPIITVEGLSHIYGPLGPLITK